MGWFWEFVVFAILGIAIERSVLWLWGRGRHWVHRRRGARTDRQLKAKGELLLVGDEAVFVAEFAPRGYLDTALRTHWEDNAPITATLPRTAGVDLTDDGVAAALAEQRRHLETAPGAWNGESLALRSLSIGRTGPREEPELDLGFALSDHASKLVAKHHWLADHHGLQGISGDDWRQVQPAFSHGFGLNATVETDDGRLLLTRRGRSTSQQGGRLHNSVNEGMRPDDLDVDGSPSPIRALRRGLHEELGITVDPEAVTFHALILDVTRYEWGLLGHVDLRGTGTTSPRVQAARAVGAASDDWEMDTITGIPFTPDEVVSLLRRDLDWVPHGRLNVAFSAAVRFPASAGRILDALAR